jgi:hypothetical protein
MSIQFDLSWFARLDNLEYTIKPGCGQRSNFRAVEFKMNYDRIRLLRIGTQAQYAKEYG